MTSRVVALIGALALVTSAVWTLTPSTAWACGGFFCSQIPVDQTGENILFAVEDGTIEAHITIQYEGEADDFAWIVPVSARPEVGVSSDVIFATLERIVGPQFVLRWEYLGDCIFPPMAEDDADFAGSAGGDPEEGDGGVTVVEQSSVGPFDFAVLQADAVEPLFDWLQANDYDIPDDVMPFVEPYVEMEGDVHFVAFRLSKDRETGDIQPITLRYDATKPMIPIQLTAIATQPDLGVTVHVLGDARSVPENYLHVHINDARIDWLSGGSNYDELVTLAMDEAGGQGFTTEYAGESSVMAEMLYREGQYDLDALAAITDPVAFFDEMRRQGFAANDQLLGLLQAFIPFPEELADEGLRPQDFYNCLECYREHLDPESFDSAGFAQALEDAIIAPLIHAQDLFDRIPYLTRLYTTLSAEEMTLDPIFAFNPDLADVSNIHEATAIVDCSDGGDPYDRPVVIRLTDGREYVIEGGAGAGAVDDFDGMPAAESIEETGATGDPVTVADNTEDINSVLVAHNDGAGFVPTEPIPLADDVVASGGSGRSRICAVSPGRVPWPVGAVFVLSLLRFRRRG